MSRHRVNHETPGALLTASRGRLGRRARSETRIVTRVVACPRCAVLRGWAGGSRRVRDIRGGVAVANCCVWPMDRCGGVGARPQLGVTRRLRKFTLGPRSGARSSCAPWPGSRRAAMSHHTAERLRVASRTPSRQAGSRQFSHPLPAAVRSTPQRSPAGGPGPPHAPTSGASDTVPPGSNRGRSPQAAASASSRALEASGSGRPALTPARSRSASRTAIAASRSPSVTPAPAASRSRPRSHAASEPASSKPSAPSSRRAVLMNARTSSSSPGAALRLPISHHLFTFAGRPYHQPPHAGERIRRRARPTARAPRSGRAAAP